MSYVYSVVVISKEVDKKKKQALLDGLNNYMEKDGQLGVPFVFADTSFCAGKKSYEHDLLVGAVNFANEDELIKSFSQIKLDEPAIMIITSPEGISTTHEHLGYKEIYL